MGGLLEHTLNNWSVFSRFSKIMNLCIYDSGRYGFSVSDSVLLHVRKGEIISLVPQTRALVKTEGLNWELNDEYLGIGSREGARNFALTTRVRISVRKGALLVFCDPRLPYSPMA
jgi:thiamine pyrophosphokinase